MVHFDFWEHCLGGQNLLFQGTFATAYFTSNSERGKQIFVLASKFRPLNSLNMGLESFGPKEVSVS